LTRAVARLLTAIAIVAGVIAALVVFTRVASASDAPRARPADDYTGTTVAMKDNDYLPQTLTVDAGAVVRWDNEGRSKHDVIPDRSATGWKSPTIKPGRDFEQKLEKPGVYGYFCSFHGAPGKGMYGTLIVKNPDGSIPTAALKRAKRAGASGRPRTIKVPQDVKRIQTAVDQAPPGSLILVAPGVYREAVTVTTDRLVIRGLDRNGVVLDGGYTLDNGVRVLGADGVAVENMTARRYTKNGFFWTGANGYRGSYLTATRNGDYGIYSFDSVDGRFDHDYGSGSPDAGFYVGQCFPCNTLITDSLAEYNGLGFSGTNAGGNLVIAKSVWRFNRAGIVPNSGDGEKNPPQHGATIVGNLIHDNDNLRSPAIDDAILAQNNGILVAGGNENLITHNRVYSHDLAGIGVVPNPDATIWLASNNRIVDNVVSNSGEADLASFAGTGNCFADNRFTTSKPSNIESVLPCSGPATPGTDELDIQKFANPEGATSVDYRKAKTPKPPRLAGMKNPAGAQARPAVNIVVHVDVNATPTPRAPRTATP
jgi:plastocyanin